MKAEDYPGVDTPVIYNVLKEDFDDDRDLTYFTTIDRPPPWSDLEQGGVTEALSHCVQQYVDEFWPDGMTETHERLWSESHVDPMRYGDRTLLIEIDEADIVTPDFVSMVQQRVLTAFPLWRIWVVGDVLGENLIIYPTAIRAGHQKPNTDMAMALAVWRQAFHKRREASLGPERRQLEYVKKRIPIALKQLNAHKFRLLGVFANELDTKKWWYMWILQSENAESLFVENATDHSYPVDADGAVGIRCRVRGDLKEDVDSEFWLVRYSHSDVKTTPTMIYVVEGNTNAEWPIVIKDTEIMTDDDLR